MLRACDNPFRVGQIHALEYVDPALNWDVVLSRLEARAWRGAIVGAHGRGKTTLLRELGTQLEGKGFAIRHVFLNDTTKWTQDAELEGRFVLLDGCEQLGPVAWRHFRWAARRSSGLVVTTHQPGCLPTLFECRTTPDLLDTLLVRLVPEAGSALRETAQGLYVEHGGDMRTVWFELYDRCARGDFGFETIRNGAGAPLV